MNRQRILLVPRHAEVEILVAGYFLQQFLQRLHVTVANAASLMIEIYDPAGETPEMKPVCARQLIVQGKVRLNAETAASGAFTPSWAFDRMP